MKITKFNELTDEGKVLKGRWKLARNHQVQFRSGSKRDQLKLTSSILDVDSHHLILSTTQKKSGKNVVTSILKVGGIWRMDPKNRIVFEAEREGGKRDILIFKGKWRVNKAHEVIYSYKQAILRKKKKPTKKLIFKGYWDILENNRLTYFLGRDSNSFFRVRGAFQTKSVFAKKGELRYQAGIEGAGKHQLQTITLFGRWKVSKRWGLAFEVQYKEGLRKAILFEGTYRLNGSTSIQVQLKSRRGKPLGATLILTRDFLQKQGQAFVRLHKSPAESKIEGGAHLEW